MLWYFYGIAGLRQVRSQLKTKSRVEGQKQRKRTKTSLEWQLFWRMTDESGQYRILKTIIHCILSDDLKKRKLCAWLVPHVLTAEQWEQRVVHAKDLTIPVLSWFKSTQLFCVSKVENWVEGRPVCNHKQHSNICNDKTEKTIPTTDFLWAMHQLEDRANQCIAVNGDYFEKKIVWFLKHSLKTYGIYNSLASNHQLCARN